MKQRWLFYTQFACEVNVRDQTDWHTLVAPFQIRDHVTSDGTFYEVTKYKQDVQQVT